MSMTFRLHRSRSVHPRSALIWIRCHRMGWRDRGMFLLTPLVSRTSRTSPGIEIRNYLMTNHHRVFTLIWLCLHRHLHRFGCSSSSRLVRLRQQPLSCRRQLLRRFLRIGYVRIVHLQDFLRSPAVGPQLFRRLITLTREGPFVLFTYGYGRLSFGVRESSELPIPGSLHTSHRQWRIRTQHSVSSYTTHGF